jgi:hypothetical protein
MLIVIQFFYTLQYQKGAFLGLILSTIINLWMGIGSVLYGRPPKIKPMRIDGCNILLNQTNFTIFSNTLSNSTQPSAAFR